MANPFTPNLIPSCLIGRAPEISSACDQIRNEGHFAISGVSGSGKSTFLRALENPKLWLPHGGHVANGISVYLDLANIQPFRPGAFWAELRDELTARLDQNDAVRNVAVNADGSANGVSSVCRAVKQSGRRIVLLLDGYDTAATPGSGYTFGDVTTHLFEMRRLAQARCFATVTASYKRLTDLGPPPEKLMGASPWYNHYLFQPISNLPETDCDQFYSWLPTLAVPETWRKALFDLCGGSPALHQHAGFILHESVARQTLPNIQEFWDRLESATRHYYKAWWMSATATEQLLMKLIAVSALQNRLDLNRNYDLRDLPIIFSQNDRQLRELCERGLVRKKGMTSYTFCSSMMEWWVLREVENTAQADSFGDREKELLHLSRAQVKSINAALHGVWQYKDTIVAAVSWFAKVFR